MLLNIRGLKQDSDLATSDIELSGIEFQSQSKSTWAGRFKRRDFGRSTDITTAGFTTTTEGTLGLIEEETRE